MTFSSAISRGSLVRAGSGAAIVPRSCIRVSATRERVKNTRRLIAQSRELLQRARQAIDSSRLLRTALERAAHRP